MDVIVLEIACSRSCFADLDSEIVLRTRGRSSLTWEGEAKTNSRPAPVTYIEPSVARCQ